MRIEPLLLGLCAPLVAVLVSLTARRPRICEAANLIAALIVFACAIPLPFLIQGRTLHFWRDYVILDPLAAWVLVCTAIVYLLASIYSIGYMRLLREDDRLFEYYALFAGFAFTILGGPLMNNIGIYWIAIELTTLVSTFLVAFEREAESMEAAWKYIMVVSAGISLALLGTILFYWAGTFVLGPSYEMTWAALGGAAFGALNGLLVQKLQAPSLIVTIGTQYVIRSFLLTFVGTALFMNIPAAMDAFGKASLFTHHASNGVVSVLPATVLVLVAAALVTWFILERTLMGRAIFAVGGNPGIAERLGINLFRVRIFVFAYAGLLAGIAGVVHVSSNRLANPFDLAGMELEIIAAVVLGGARITGGSGSVIGTLLGVLLITIVSNVLIFVGIPSTLQLAIVGIFILLAGTIFALRNRS